MPAKTKQTQKEDLENVHGRDLFMTPRYATELIVPFLKSNSTIWECAAGQKKMSSVLENNGFKVFETDLSYDEPFNFLTGEPLFKFNLIVTNPPFSLKKKFYDRCVEIGSPFALLIPADYSGWIIEAIENGAEKIIPTRRIDYITPNILGRIWVGENFEEWANKNKWKYTLKETQKMDEWRDIVGQFDPQKYEYPSIYTTPPKLLRKYSSSDFHSMWLTWGLDLGKTETFVELTNEMKDNI